MAMTTRANEQDHHSNGHENGNCDLGEEPAHNRPSAPRPQGPAEQYAKQRYSHYPSEGEFFGNMSTHLITPAPRCQTRPILTVPPAAPTLYGARMTKPFARSNRGDHRRVRRDRAWRARASSPRPAPASCWSLPRRRGARAVRGSEVAAIGPALAIAADVAAPDGPERS